MSPSVTFVALTDSQVRSRFERIIRYLDHWGDVVAVDRGRRTYRRLLEFSVVSPGGGLEVEARELFREYFDRDAQGEWALAKYTYEYLDTVNRARLAFHVHDLSGRQQVAHAHCEESVDIPETERSAHLRSVEYELREAHEVFMAFYASGEPPDCTEFLPLAVDRS